MGLKGLAGFKKLETLTLRTVLTDGNLKVLREAGLLHVLAVAEGEKGKRRNADEVVSLNLDDSEVTDAGLKELAGLKGLASLNLSSSSIYRHNKVTDVCLKDLAPFEKLARLELAKTKVHNKGLKELAGLKGLAFLDLSGTKVTDKGLTELAGLKSLAYLDLRDTKVSDEGLIELAGLEQLTTLLVNPVTDDTLTALREINKLHALEYAEGEKKKRPRNAAEVVSLSLKYLDVTDAGLQELAGLKGSSRSTCPEPTSPTRASRSWRHLKSLPAWNWATRR